MGSSEGLNESNDMNYIIEDIHVQLKDNECTKLRPVMIWAALNEHIFTVYYWLSRIGLRSQIIVSVAD